MTVTGSTARSVVDLVPWDAESTEHVDRLIAQRIDCNWDYDKPAGPWKQAQQEGRKCIYWLVLSKDDAQADAKLAQHTTTFPQQKKPLLDTCKSLRGVPVEPSNKEFIPVGHIALDMSFPATDKFNLDIPSEGVIWIKSLYITTPLQSGGLGRAAMDTLEGMATSAPLSARTLMLDTMHKDDQKMMRPWIKATNQEWYERRGYRLIYTEPNFYDVEAEKTAQGLDELVTRAVFMRRDLE